MMPENAALIHPGEILLTEFMEPLGLTAYRLAKDLAVPAPRVGDIVPCAWESILDFRRSSGSICRTSTTCGERL
jgi:hypothetical protein